MLILGSILRFIIPENMEWKYDEAWMYQVTTSIANGEYWSWLGMRSGVNIKNPGMSIWPFSFFALFTTTPIGMVRWVMALNILTLWGYFFLVKKRFIATKEQEKIWLYGIALFAVSPLAILFSRKIWAQDILPFFVILTLTGHLFRKRKIGAIIWGMTGALLGQIHMSGFFFALGLFLVTLYYDYRLKKDLSWFWWWILGSVLGTLPMLPWLSYLLTEGTGGGTKWKNLYKFRFFYFWPLDALGIHLRYSLKNEFWDFLRYPYLFGVPSYLMGICHLFLIGVGLSLSKRIISSIKKAKSYLTDLAELAKWSALDFYLVTSLVGIGIILGFSGVTLHEHYLIIVYPFPALWLAKLLQKREKILIMVILSQALISINFLYYLHLNGGASTGDYGKSYSRQLEQGILMKVDPRQ